MDAKARLARKRSLVERELDRLLSPQDSLLHEAMRYAVLSGGKRFRPLLLLSAGACFGAEEKMLIPFACGLELIHSYSLVHDDLPSMDDDDTRRGKPSCHKAYGEAIALLAGDGLLTLAFEVMASAPVPRPLLPQKEEVIAETARLAGPLGMIEGQFLDISTPAEGWTEGRLQVMILRKTGALIMASVRAGAVLGSARASAIEAVTQYGKYLGLAFQIRDDLQDVPAGHAQAGSQGPNYAAFLDARKAKRTMKEYIREALRALERESLRSPDLCYLASLLDRIKD
jgi:geranylgeranyl diphosphate synthase type II